MEEYIYKSYIGHCEKCGANFLYHVEDVKEGFVNCLSCGGSVDHKKSEEFD